MSLLSPQNGTTISRPVMVGTSPVTAGATAGSLVSASPAPPNYQVTQPLPGPAAGLPPETTPEPAKKKSYASSVREYKEAVCAKASVIEKYLIETFPNLKMPENIKQALAFLTLPVNTRHTGFKGASVFSIIFGDNPKPGDKVTSLEVYKRTRKGDQQIRAMLIQWAKKGVKIHFTPNKDNPLESVYELITV